MYQRWTSASLPHSPSSSSACVLQEIRNLHNEQLMGIRREEEMEMSDDDMEDTPDSKDSEDSGRDGRALWVQPAFVSMTGDWR